nr:hypothetical protein [Candidatus Nitrotoga arctica]
MAADAILALPVTELKLTLYGKEQLISLRSVGCNDALSQRHAGTSRVVLVLQCRQTEQVKSTLVVGDRNRIKCRGNPSTVRTLLGNRTLVSQPETLVGCQQLVATKTHCAGTMNTDSFHGVDASSFSSINITI